MDILSLEEALESFLHEKPLPGDEEEVHVSTTIDTGTFMDLAISSTSTQTDGERCPHGNLLPVHKYVVHTASGPEQICGELTLRVNCSSCPPPYFNLQRMHDSGLL
jgi:hypothetical protein